MSAPMGIVASGDHGDHGNRDGANVIGFLSGTVFDRDLTHGRVILDVHGVGYELTVSLQTLAEVPEPGEECRLWVHTHAREDTLGLFGPLEHPAELGEGCFDPSCRTRVLRTNTTFNTFEQ